MDNCNGSIKSDVIKEIMLAIILFIGLAAYWLVLLLSVSFVFHSIISIDIYTIIKISIGLSIIMMMWRTMRRIRRR